MALAGVPRIAPALVERPRLTAAFDRDAPLVVAVAPIGSGKTVAMAHWAQTTTRQGLWLRIPDGVVEPKALVDLIAAALADFGMIGADNPLYSANESLSAKGGAAELLTRGVRRIGGPVVLALDEVDHLGDEALAVLLRTLEDVPALSIRATARRTNRLGEPALALTLGARRIEAAELAMTADEATAVLGDRGRVSEALVAGGAPGIVRAIALGAVGSGAGAAEDLGRLAASLFRVRGVSWDEGFVDFLADVCLPDGIDARLAAELSGRADAALLLDRADAEGLGAWTSPQGRDAPRFLLSPFIRYEAERRLRARRSPTELRALLRRIAEWERRAGNPFAALRRAVEADDLALASDIVRDAWYDLLAYGGAVLGLFRGVSPVTLRSWPFLAMLLGIITNARAAGRLRAIEYFAIASYGARAARRSASPADRALLHGMESAAQRVSGHTDRALASARAAHAALTELGTDGRARLGRNAPILYGHIGLSFFYAGDSAAALECFTAALAGYDARGPIGGATALALIAGVHAASGDVNDAVPVIEEAERRVWPDGWRSGYPGTFLQLARAHVALEAADPDAALAELRIVDGTLPENEHWALLLHAELVAMLLQRRSEEAALRLDHGIRVQRARHAALALPMSRLRHTRVLVELARGDLAAAEKAIAKAPDGPRESVSRARIALAVGEPGRALRLLQDHATTRVSSRQDAERLALRAAAIAMDEPGHRLLRGALEQLDALLAERGLLLPLALVPSAGLEAIAAADPPPGLRDRVERARALAIVDTSPRPRPRLTPREIAVARELARTDSVAQLAQALAVSQNTVKSQLRSLYRKLGVGRREEAVRELALLGITAEETAPR